MLKARQPDIDNSYSSISKKTSSVNIESEDSKVDTSDIPELTDKEWANSEKNLFYRPDAILSRNKI